MAFEPKSSYSRSELLMCARGELFPGGTPRLPLPDMLMIDRITRIAGEGGAFGLGEVVGEMDVRPDAWFFDVLPRLPNIWRRIRQSVDAVIAQGPYALVILDSPEFTHQVAKRVRKRAPQIPIIDYVSPSVWACPSSAWSTTPGTRATAAPCWPPSTFCPAAPST